MKVRASSSYIGSIPNRVSRHAGAAAAVDECHAAVPKETGTREITVLPLLDSITLTRF
jgi:hypothetical protein